MTTEQKKYTDIVRLGHKTTIGVLNVGDQIVIQEKIDGANASFFYDEETGGIRVFSRNTELNQDNNLGGFYEWVHTNIDTKNILKGVWYYGEWTNPHKVRYTPENTKTFFLFDLFNMYIHEYMDFSAVELEAKRLGLKTVPVFYRGEYISFEHLQSFVGKSALGGKLGDVETGEGIVIKNVTYRDRYDRQVFVKMVVDEFREVQKQKPARDPNRPETEEALWVRTNMTDARIEKLLYKLVDEGILDEQFGIEDMGTILKNLGTKVYDDMMKEESDSLPNEFEEKNVRQTIGKLLPNIVKQIINSRGV